MYLIRGGASARSYDAWASGRYHDPELDAAIAAYPRKRAARLAAEQQRRDRIRRGRVALMGPAAQMAALWRRVHGDIPMTAAGRREEWERLRAEVDQGGVERAGCTYPGRSGRDPSSAVQAETPHLHAGSRNESR